MRSTESESEVAPPSLAVALLFIGWILAAWTAAWAAFEFLKPRVPALETPGGATVYWIGWKAAVWILPALYIMRRGRFRARDALGSSAPVRALGWGLGLGGALALVHLLVNGEVAPPAVGWALLNAVVVAPIVEEVAIRGVVQPAATQRFGPVRGITLSAAMFVLVHCPGWFFQGRLIDMLTDPVGGALTIFFLGVLFGIAAHRSGSITAPIIAHAINNLTS